MGEGLEEEKEKEESTHQEEVHFSIFQAIPSHLSDFLFGPGIISFYEIIYLGNCNSQDEYLHCLLYFISVNKA